MVSRQEIAPGAVAEIRRSRGRVDEIREQQSYQYAIRLQRLFRTAQEALDFNRDLGRLKEAPLVVAGNPC